MRRCFLFLSCLFLIASFGCQEAATGDPDVRKEKKEASEEDLKMDNTSNVQEAPPA